jgi:hypothetical protein
MEHIHTNRHYVAKHYRRKQDVKLIKRIAERKEISFKEAARILYHREF